MSASVLETIGQTPLVELNRYTKARGLTARLFAKCEGGNPGGSAKDRVALSILRDAEASGRLRSGGTVIEATSGNTGVGLALCAGLLGYRVVLTMPENMSAERRKLLVAYGAQLVLTPAAHGMAGAVERAEQLLSETENAILADQFANPANPAAHYRTTGPELWRQTGGALDAFIACVGTGGTVTGTGRFLKERSARVRVFGVEPAESPLLTRGVSGPHGIQGIGANFVPAVLDRALLDGVLTVSTDEAAHTARVLAREEGLLCGYSAGAAVAGAAQLAQQPDWAGRSIAVILPDTGERYLSSGLFGQ